MCQRKVGFSYKKIVRVSLHEKSREIIRGG